MVCRLYKHYAHPVARVVYGLPISWRQNFATMKHSGYIRTVAWSSCSRFIVVDLNESTKVLDTVTLERLHTFTHPWSETGLFCFSPDNRSLTRIDEGFTTWDLQTGGQISATPPRLNIYDTRYFSSTYSTDGKIVAVAFEDLEDRTVTGISTYNPISGTHIYSHRTTEGRIIAPIWTRGEFLQFAAVKPGSITIWELGFTSEHTLAEIESLPAPDDTGSGERLFLPTPYRLAFILQNMVLIWDARDSKFLLNFKGSSRLRGFSFSPDGRFFACGVSGQGVYLWKESPTGYIPHQTLLSKPVDDWITPFLSPDGESIITSKYGETQLWRTADPINPPSSVPPQPAKQTDFILAFSPDKSFIATGRSRGNVATVVDLRSGDSRLIVDAGMEILGLGMTGSTVIVVGEGKISTWNLPVGDCVLDARANIHDSVRTIVFNHPPLLPGLLHSALISPDSNHLVITGSRGEGLDIYNVSTGKHVVATTIGAHSRPWFTRDGREVWSSGLLSSKGKKIIRGGESDVIGLEPIGDGDGPSGGYPWESAHGHEITDDGWILDSGKKRVMWLPHHWRFYFRLIWDGRFLTLLDRGLPEPVIIELYE